MIFEKVDFRPRFDCALRQLLNPERVNVISIITQPSRFLITRVALTQNIRSHADPLILVTGTALQHFV